MAPDQANRGAALRVLYNGPSLVGENSGDVDVDIIAVPGLGSDGNRAWTWDEGSNNTNWLKDTEMLPSVMPRSRIVCYSYQSQWMDDAPRTRPEALGKELIRNVRQFRGNEHANRPILLIGYSLGGIIIEHGLLYAENDPQYSPLVKLTAGLIFLGCPFRGTKKSWLASAVVRVKPGAYGGIVNALRYDDKTLSDKMDAFVIFLRKNSITARCFVEMKPTRGVGMLVSEESAGALDPAKVYLDTDHIHVNKYYGPEDPSFTKVSGVIKEVWLASQAGKVAVGRSGSGKPGAAWKLRAVERHKVRVKEKERLNEEMDKEIQRREAVEEERKGRAQQRRAQKQRREVERREDLERLLKMMAEGRRQQPVAAKTRQETDRAEAELEEAERTEAEDVRDEETDGDEDGESDDSELED